MLINTIVNVVIEIITIKASIFAFCMIEKSYVSCHIKIEIMQRLCFFEMGYEYYSNFVSFPKWNNLKIHFA